MLYSSKAMEEEAIIKTAAQMCAAARTAPKTRGVDNIITLVLTGEEKDALARKMEDINIREFGTTEGSFVRDAKNLFNAYAIVLIGVKKVYCGLKFCSLCGFESCESCQNAGGRCAFNATDLGIALGSAVAIAADARIDNRIMYSAGKAAQEMGYTDEKDVVWHGVPLSAHGKNIFFDRK